MRRPTNNSAYQHELEDIGTMYIINACQQADVKQVLSVTSASLYGPWPDNPAWLSEEHEARGLPGVAFFEEKINAERQLLAFQRRDNSRCVTILRPAWPIGPSSGSYIQRMLQSAIVPTVAGFDPLIQVLHEDDLMNAFLLAFRRPHCGLFNIASDGVLPLSYAIRQAGRLPLQLPWSLLRSYTGLMWAFQQTELPPEFLPFLKYSCIASSQKAQSLLGYKACFRIQDALADISPTAIHSSQRTLT
jgi:UDP-glucose 4-epimerase